MLIDGRELPAGSDLRADVCVVGAGPAGITLAIELGRAGVDVLLLESGGITRERGADRLRGGHSVGYPMSVARTRARGVGGSSLAWLPSNSLRARPLDPIDFESREGVPHSGWPFGRAHLDSYYERAHIYAGMGPYRYDVDYWSEPPNAMPIELTDGDVGTTIFQFGEPDRWRSYLTDLTASGHIRLVTHATVLEVCTEDVPNMVSRLRVRASADGQEFYASGRRYVLALGGLENPRLLLASDRIHKRGVGNAHDLVGRFFMEHLSCDTGRLRPADQGLVHRLDLYRQRHVSHGHPIQGMITVSEQAVRKHGLRNATFWVHPADEHWLRPASVRRAFCSRHYGAAR